MSQSKHKPKDLDSVQVTAVAGQAAALMKDKEVSRRYKLIVLICTVLLVSPVDLLPELVLGPFGLIDDAGYLATGVTYAIFALRHKSMKVLSGGGKAKGSTPHAT